jgi:hypothetical protein
MMTERSSFLLDLDIRRAQTLKASARAFFALWLSWRNGRDMVKNIESDIQQKLNTNTLLHYLTLKSSAVIVLSSRPLEVQA